MSDGLFVLGLGVALVLFGLLGVLPGRLDKSMPKSTGYARGQEVGSYFVLGLGGLLVVGGLVAVVVDLIN